MEENDSEPYYWALFPAITIDAQFNTGLLAGLIVLVLLFLCSALVSGSEIAFFSLSPGQINKLKNSKAKRSSSILSLLERPKRLLATILISNNFINVAIVILATYLTALIFDLSVYPVIGFLIEVFVITALILFFGEIMPKIYANQQPVKFANLMALPLIFLTRLFHPLSSILVKSTNIIDKRLGKRSRNISMSELSEAIEITSDESTPEEERKILKGIVKFGDIEVKEIMKSRMDVTAVDTDIDFGELIEIIVDSGYSRIPAYEESFDKIKGILYVKDLLPHIGKNGNFQWQSLLRQAFFVPENKKINDLLQEFQDKKIHLAIVVDEYGGTSGIVTLEDIIEEIVGEISDEFDTENDEIDYSKLDENSYVFEGKTSINDFCKILEIDDDIFDEVKGESDTLAGLILETEGKIPGKDEVIKINDFKFKILRVDKRRIKKIQVVYAPNS